MIVKLDPEQLAKRLADESIKQKYPVMNLYDKNGTLASWAQSEHDASYQHYLTIIKEESHGL